MFSLSLIKKPQHKPEGRLRWSGKKRHSWQSSRLTSHALSSLTGFGVLVLRVSEGEVGVGPARQAGAASGLGAASPEPHRVLRRHDHVGLRVGIRAGADGVAAVRQADISPVQSPMCGCHIFKTQLSQREVGSWERTQQPGYSSIGGGFISHGSMAEPLILCLLVGHSSSRVPASYPIPPFCGLA